MKNYIKAAIISTVVSLSSNAFAANECSLGNECAVPNTLDNLYYAFKPDQATKFKCDLRATKGDDLEVQLSSGEDFEFPTQTLRADKSGEAVSAIIPGKFKKGATRGTLVIHQSILTSKAEGSIKCSPQ